MPFCYNVRMRYAIISDIHANESALRHVLADAAALGAERIVCLGDVVGYGPLPKETLARVRATAAVTLAGNHDDAVSGRQGADAFIDLAGEAVRRHRDALDAGDLAWLRSLPYDCAFDGAIAAHGDIADPKKFYYVENEEDAAANFNATDAQLVFVGHTHVPCIFLTGQSGKVYRLDAQDFTLEDGKRYIVNPGSVGYPRESNGECFSSYVIYDSTARAVSYRRLPFSVASVMQRGVNPRRRRIGLVAAAAILSLGVVAGALVLRQQKPTSVKTVTEVKTNTVEVAAKPDASLVLAEKTLALAPGMRFVRANLALDKAGGPVDLHIAFSSASGASLGTFDKTVKGSSRERIKIPEAARSARFAVRRPARDATPKILSFAPAAAAK